MGRASSHKLESTQTLTLVILSAVLARRTLCFALCFESLRVSVVKHAPDEFSVNTQELHDSCQPPDSKPNIIIDNVA